MRTPDERFNDLPDYPFAPAYVDVGAGDGSGDRLRVHYVDEGDGSSGETVLLLHGQPSWSYLYRHMIPPLGQAGHRCVAPDLIGFGRSDKPAARSDYTYQRHVDWMREALFDRLDLRGITLVCQDWGGLIGLRLVAEHPDRFARVVVANTFLPTGDAEPTKAFLQWREFSQNTPELHVGAIVDSGCRSDLSPAVTAAYDAPFPDDSFKAGARRFPVLVPVSPDDPAAGPNREAWQALQHFDKPFLCAFSDQDPITRGLDRVFQERVPGARGQNHTTIRDGGHFLQEDRGSELAGIVNRFIAAEPLPS
ncbi:haloalkane dehalogenase [Streptomyces sp. HNM0663]|uniref:Haloalkane dehalogenase n=1 Tax=Streptomyces chengmaiensis TaxID=3040919 RepID=A0ABT6HGQ1_9ACTN|nr:haloalkane dehalogenase [Streptomyces chengmaiensis]MDH2387937.1 haloalkane dehalogenase [Streptomyces chengmaiensis]